MFRLVCITSRLQVNNEKLMSADEFRWKIREILGKSDTPKPNFSQDEQMALRHLRTDTIIKIVPADKGK